MEGGRREGGSQAGRQGGREGVEGGREVKWKVVLTGVGAVAMV